MSQAFTSLSNVAATALSFFNGSNSNEFSLVDPDSGLSVLIFSSMLEFNLRAEGYAVSAPVEQGSFASYNKVDSPNLLEVQIAIQGTDDELQIALKTLDGLQSSASKLNFVTPVAEYANYTLESYDFSMKRRDGLGVLYIRLRLVEIREVEARYTETKPISSGNAKNPANASTTDRGKTQAQTPTAEQKAASDSTLYKIKTGQVF